MTFLELCKRVRQDAGVSGEGPTSVSDQNGMLGKIVTWVKNANNELQLLNTDWRFLWRLGQGNSIANVSEYFPADFGISDMRSIASFYYDGAAIGLQDWNWYLDNVLATARTEEQGLPRIVATRPDGKLILWPTPNEAAPVVVNYYRKPVPLVNGTDISVIPEEYHEAIVCSALMKYAHSEEDPYLFQTKAAEYKQWINQLNQTEQPQITFSSSSISIEFA